MRELVNEYSVYADLVQCTFECEMEKALRKNKIFEEVPYEIKGTIYKEEDYLVYKIELVYNDKSIIELEQLLNENICVFEDDLEEFSKQLLNCIEGE